MGQIVSIISCRVHRADPKCECQMPAKIESVCHQSVALIWHLISTKMQFPSFLLQLTRLHSAVALTIHQYTAFGVDRGIPMRVNEKKVSLSLSLESVHGIFNHDHRLDHHHHRKPSIHKACLFALFLSNTEMPLTSCCRYNMPDTRACLSSWLSAGCSIGGLPGQTLLPPLNCGVSDQSTNKYFYTGRSFNRVDTGVTCVCKKGR